MLCCLSYENEQYRQMKAVMPRLGQPIDTPAGPGMVLSLQILKQLVTVRLNEDNTDHVFRSDELGFARPEPKPVRAEPLRTEITAGIPTVESALPESDGEAGQDKSGGRRRRRRRGRSRSQSPQA